MTLARTHTAVQTRRDESRLPTERQCRAPLDAHVTSRRGRRCGRAGQRASIRRRGLHLRDPAVVRARTASLSDDAPPLLVREQRGKIRGRCATPPAAPQRIEKVINECQDDIKLSIIEEALSVLGESATELISKEVKGRAPAKSRAKRQAFTEDERRIAGCLLHCVYKKVKALNPAGVPTGEGLVKLYAEGVQDASYFLATAQAVNHCLGAAQQQGRLLPQSVKEPGQKCYLAYDLFECVSDQIIEYCGASP